jgi:hypothetical protein
MAFLVMRSSGLNKCTHARMDGCARRKATWLTTYIHYHRMSYRTRVGVGKKKEKKGKEKLRHKDGPDQTYNDQEPVGLGIFKIRDANNVGNMLSGPQ